jgi:hypothetical protein
MFDKQGWSRFHIVIAILSTAVLSGCGKTIRWEEEVPLNTGEILVVERIAKFKRGSEPGNPLKAAWWPEGGSIGFSLDGQRFVYEYSGRMNAFGIFVVGSRQSPSIVDYTGHKCAQPGLGEFRWHSGQWELQRALSGELLGRPRNLIYAEADPDSAWPKRVTAEYREKADTQIFADQARGGVPSRATLMNDLVAQGCR